MRQPGAITAVRLLAAAGYLLAGLTGVAILAAGMLFFHAAGSLPKVPAPLRRIIETPPTQILAANGQVLWSSGPAAFVPLEQVSPAFVQAILATEDHRFWDHRGVSKLRTLKALYLALTGSGRLQGASTITQQLAKNLFFSFRKTYWRKFRELLVALQIEAQFSKRQILEAYLNQISFGAGARGVEQAAQYFFGKSAADLDLAEASLLAGLPQSPSRYNPLHHMQRAKQRQKVVLARMVAAGYIDADQAEQAWAQPLQLAGGGQAVRQAPYFVDWILRQLEKRYGPEAVYHGGLRVTTTLDPAIQRAAEKAVTAGVTRLRRRLNHDGRQGDEVQAALVAVQVSSGAVKAMVGGADYGHSPFNRATDSLRQPGSAFKPFLYYAAFDRLGLGPDTVMVDRPVTVAVAGADDWRPENFGGTYRGEMILKTAFMDSVNTIAAQLAEKVGPEAIVEVARSCGITSELSPVLSVALGSSGVSCLEMAGAVATFADAGVAHRPFGIWRVEDAQGRVLEEQLVERRQVLDPVGAYQVVDMMRAVVDGGTGKVVRALGFQRPAAGKTGTTNGFRDAWFVGFTPSLSAAVWVGRDRNGGLKDASGRGWTGGMAAAPIWTAFMKQATAADPLRPFPAPSQVRIERRNRWTGRPAAPDDPEGIDVVLDARRSPDGLVPDDGGW